MFSKSREQYPPVRKCGLLNRHTVLSSPESAMSPHVALSLFNRIILRRSYATKKTLLSTLKSSCKTIEFRKGDPGADPISPMQTIFDARTKDAWERTNCVG